MWELIKHLPAPPDAVARWAPVVGPLVTIVGWFAAYAFALRSQRGTVRMQILSEVRNSITASLAEYDAWLLSLSFAIRPVPFGLAGDREDFKAAASKVASLFDQKGERHQWRQTLRAYETVFDLRPYWKELERGETLVRYVADVFSSAAARYDPSVEIDLQHLKSCQDHAIEQLHKHQSRIREIQVAVQRSALSETFSRPIPLKADMPQPERLDADDPGLSESGN